MPAATTVSDVIARLREIESTAAPHDGVACFTRLYLAVTENVQAALGQATFSNPAFLARLDVVFANLFFAAVDTPKPPRAWAPLIDDRARAHIAAIQFALAGMNAHINRDLPVALVQTAQERGVDLASARGVRKDYLAVNALLRATEATVKKQFLTGLAGLADDALQTLDDRVAMWDVEKAREAAWVQGQVLWHLRGLPPLSKRYLDTLDRTVGFAGRGLLLPLPV